MAKYYFVGTLLPSLSFDVPPEISFEKLRDLLRLNLTSKDYEKTKMIRHMFDILNLRLLWQEKELDPRGEFTSWELDEALVNRVGLPEYVYEFIEHYPKIEDRLHHFAFLSAKFFQEAEHLQDSFLRRYFRFERELRLVMTAFRAKRLGRDLSQELQYENPEEDLIAQLLAQRDAKSYEPPEKYQDLKIVFDQHGNNPLALQRAVDEYRFKKVEDLVEMADFFSIERILVYLIQLLILQKWFALGGVRK